MVPVVMTNTAREHLPAVTGHEVPTLYMRGNHVAPTLRYTSPPGVAVGLHDSWLGPDPLLEVPISRSLDAVATFVLRTLAPLDIAAWLHF